MSLFLAFANGETKTLRFFEPGEKEFISNVTGTKRYARRVIDRRAQVVSIWTYAWPVKRALDDAFAKARLDPWDADITVTGEGDGRERRYSVAVCQEAMLTGADQLAIDQASRLTLGVCK